MDETATNGGKGIPIVPRESPAGYRKKWKHWGFLSTIWIFWHYSLGIVGIIVAALIPILPDDKPLQAALSAAAVICTSLVTFLSARKTANLFLHVWRLMEVGRLRYMYDPTMVENDLQKIVEDAEAYLEAAENEGSLMTQPGLSTSHPR